MCLLDYHKLFNHSQKVDKVSHFWSFCFQNSSNQLLSQGQGVSTFRLQPDDTLGKNFINIFRCEKFSCGEFNVEDF